MEKVTKLRDIVSKDSNKPKALARLSFLLVEQAKAIRPQDHDGNEKESLYQEAYQLSKRSIELAPDQPLGYAAISVSSPNFEERMRALEIAIKLDTELQVQNAGSMVARATSLVRLLVEPRDQEKQDSNGNGVRGNAKSKKDARRDLSTKEEQLYNETRISLEEAKQLVVAQTDEQSQESSRCLLCLGNGHYRLGMFFRKLIPEKIHRDKAIFHYTNAIKLLPKDDKMSEKCAFWLATMDSHQVSMDLGIVSRCPEEYIVSLYSSFASKFDDLLVNKLQYQTPSKLRQVVDKVHTRTYTSITDSPKRFQCGLDLGCGTGLSGLAFHNCVASLSGVDLSPEMIERAKQRSCYSNLFVGDLESVFVATRLWIPPSFDIVIACDVFVYVGDLKSIFYSVRKNINRDGVFAFSTEALDEGECGTNPFTLHKNARFAHKKSYIENLANESKFMLDSITKSVIRKNQGKDVHGFLVVLRPDETNERNVSE